MRYVLDASVALKWVLPEVHRDKALHLREEFRRGLHELIAPDIFPVEVAHVLSKLHRQRKLNEDDAEAFLAEVLSTPPQQLFTAVYLARAYDLSLQTRSSVYDCLYLALAEDKNCPLVTADTRLINNMNSPSNIIHLSTL
jgi:predicted nucleic acid-binding protein